MAILAGNNFNVKDFAPALWLDAADSNTLYDAVSGGALVAAGGAVARWEDKSGNGRHATQTTLSNRPTRTVGAQNTRDALRFNGSNSFMFAGSNTDWSFLHNDAAASVFIAVKTGVSNDPNAVYSFLSTGGESSADTGYYLGYDDRSAFSRNNAIGISISRGVSNSFAVNTINLNILIPNQFNIISNEVDADNATASNRSIVRVNGASESKINTLTNAPSLNISSSYKMTIGAFVNGTSAFLAGDIAEIIILPYAATNAQRQSIERYLANKWGLGFNPLSLSPALWLDASDSNTLYDATTGGALVGAGGTVARWEDKSGNARHATQATLANRPLRTTAAQGGKDALTFDGSNDFLQILTGLNMLRNVTGTTVFCVWKYNVVPISGNFVAPFIVSNGTVLGTARLSMGTNLGTTKIFAGGRRLDADALQRIDSIIDVNTTPFVQTAVLDYANSDIFQFINGSLQGSSTSFQTNGNTSDTNSIHIYIGSHTGASNFANIDIAEIIVFPTALSTAQRQAVERYLAQKWNIIT
jgi:hypothetical protein